jgi:hypothetical protein
VAAEPILKSDAIIDVDQVATEIAQETGVAPEAIGAGVDGTTDPEATTPSARARKRAQKNAPKTPRAPSSRSRSTAPGSAVSGFAIGSRRALSRDQEVQPTEIRKFVGDYPRGDGQRQIGPGLAFYADRVSYYQNGDIDRRIVERTLRNYYKQWPKRKYRLGKAVEFARRPATGEILVAFRVEFTLRTGAGR